MSKKRSRPPVGKKKAKKRRHRGHVVALRQLPYRAYLHTDHWLHVRKRALDYIGHVCELCTSTLNLQVHHRHYGNIGCEMMADLLVVCGRCHQGIHAHDPVWATTEQTAPASICEVADAIKLSVPRWNVG